jgi:Putative adhesin
MNICMTRRAILCSSLLAALLLALPALAADDTFDRTLSVNGTVTLSVTTASGSIHVNSGSADKVRVVGHVKANSGWFGGGAADAVAKVVAAPPIDQAGNIIRIGSLRDESPYRDVTIDYEITVPQSALLTAESSSGGIQLSNLSGTVKAEAGSGSIDATALGPGSVLETGSGSIDVTGLAGSTTLSTGSGHIRAQISSPGDVTAATGSGGISLSNVQGALNAEAGSGGIDISGQPTSPWKIKTGSGSITLSVGKAHFNLDAETSSGTVRSDLPVGVQGSDTQGPGIRGASDKRHLSGPVNGGGPTVKAQTGSGSIRIVQ